MEYENTDDLLNDGIAEEVVAAASQGGNGPGQFHKGLNEHRRTKTRPPEKSPNPIRPDKVLRRRDVVSPRERSSLTMLIGIDLRLV
jgi:hypothetical protein